MPMPVAVSLATNVPTSSKTELLRLLHVLGHRAATGTERQSGGTYTVCEEITDHSGWVQSYPTASTTGSASCTALGAALAARGWSVTVTSQGTVSLRDFGNTPLSKVQVNFLPPATLPDGTDATHATSITCTPGGGNTNSNTFTTSDLRISQGTTITCTITYVDP